ncbi:MAG TPA: orotate phosphoribosyltransferase [Tissierellia bacterium]|nr:orotate phosphoribosyltransferase [Tissierellia bacterium]
MTYRKIAQHLLDIGALIIRDKDNLFTWASGIRSPIYCDNRLTMSFPVVRDAIAEAFAEKVKDLGDVDAIVGTATAGIAHAAYLSQKLDLPMAYVRSGAKDHGKGEQIEGIVIKGDRVVLVEDLISTGGSSLKAAKALQVAGAEVVCVLSIFTYGFSEATEAFEREGIPVWSLTDYAEVLTLAQERGLVSDEDALLLSQWSQNPRMFT